MAGLPHPREQEPSPCRSCPRKDERPLRPIFAYYLLAYRMLKLTGSLPHGRGWLFEDQRLLDALLIIDEETTEILMKKQEQELRRLRLNGRS